MMAAKPKKIYANRYEVLEEFEGGNFGKVYLCKDLKPNDAQDRKVLKKIKIKSEKALDSAEKEAGIICKLVHPGILKHFDHVQIENGFIIVTEYCEGGDLRGKINSCKREKRSFSEKKIQHMTVQLAMALEYIHSHGIIHRDLKPENIFICNNVLKIGDFGISHVFQKSVLAFSFGGTIPYMAPEMFSDKGHTSAVDIWALGCIVYELCTLQRAFDDEKIVYKITYGPLPVLPSSEHASSLVSLVKWTLCRDVHTRMSAYRVAQECINADFMADVEDSLKEKYLTKWNESRTVRAQSRRELADLVDSRKQKRDGSKSKKDESHSSSSTQSSVDSGLGSSLPRSSSTDSKKDEGYQADVSRTFSSSSTRGAKDRQSARSRDRRHREGICVVCEVEPDRGFKDDDDGIPSTPSAANAHYKSDFEADDDDQGFDGIAEAIVIPGSDEIADDHRYGQGIRVVSEVEAEKGFEDDDDDDLVWDVAWVSLGLKEKIREIEELTFQSKQVMTEEEFDEAYKYFKKGGLSTNQGVLEQVKPPPDSFMMLVLLEQQLSCELS